MSKRLVIRGGQPEKTDAEKTDNGVDSRRSFLEEKRLLIIFNKYSLRSKEYLLESTPVTEKKKRLVVRYKDNRRAFLNNYKPLQDPVVEKPTKKRIPIKTIYIPNDFRPVIDLWNELCYKPIVNPSAVLRNAIVFLRDVKANRFVPRLGVTYTDIEKSIRNFALAQNNMQYKPLSKDYLRSITFDKFLFSPFSTNHKSLFLEYLDNSPQQLNGSVQQEDKNPIVSNRLMFRYTTEILDNVGGMSPADRAKFVLAANKLVDYLTEIKPRLSIGWKNIHEIDMADLLFNSVVETSGDFQITPGFFCSDETFNRRLPQYLSKQAILTNETVGMNIYQPKY